MIVVAHQAEDPQIDVVRSHDLLEDLKEARVIQIVKEDGHLVVAACHDVVRETGAEET